MLFLYIIWLEPIYKGIIAQLHFLNYLFLNYHEGQYVSINLTQAYIIDPLGAIDGC